MMLCDTIKDLSKIKENKYFYEIKLDGTRGMFHLQRENTLINRRGINTLNRYPELKNLIISQGRCVLDGELVVMNKGKCDFSALLSREHLKGEFKIKMLSKIYPVTFYAFDIVIHRGKDVSQLPLKKRKEYLDTLKQYENDNFKIIPYHTKLERVLKQMKEFKHEGIILKEKNSKYYFGVRSNAWLKFKKRIELVVDMTTYENNTDGSITLTNGFNRVKCNNDIEMVVHELEQEGKISVEIEGLELTKNGHIRFPILKRIMV